MSAAIVIWQERPGGREAPLQVVMVLAQLFDGLEVNGELRETLHDAHPALLTWALRVKAAHFGPGGDAIERWDAAVDNRYDDAYPTGMKIEPLGMIEYAAELDTLLAELVVMIGTARVALMADAKAMTVAYGELLAGQAMCRHGAMVGCEVVRLPDAECPAL